MKNLLLIICCLMLQSSLLKAQGQFSSFGVGYYMNLNSPVGLDDFVNRYNFSRNAEQGIDNFSLNGWEIGFLSDLNSDKIEESRSNNGFAFESQYSYMEIGYFQSGKTQSLMLTNGFQEDLRIRNRGLYLGAGTSFMNYGNLQLLGGFRTYIGLIRGHTRFSDVTTISDTDWNQVHSDLYFDLSLGLKIKYGGIWLEPYYLFNTDALLERMIDIDRSNLGLNPFYENMNVPNFGAEDFLKLKGFGLRFHVGF